MPSISAIIKAVEPMMGGMMAPPVEAVASTAAANSGSKPFFFIIGMVKVPVPMTLAVGLPLMEPKKPEATTATLAGPPRMWPNREVARLVI